MNYQDQNSESQQEYFGLARQDAREAALSNFGVVQPQADPRELQLVAMFRGIDDRAQATTMAMMAVAFKMHRRAN